MGAGDSVNIGTTLRFGDDIDNHRSAIWNSNATKLNGNGFTNNEVFI